MRAELLALGIHAANHHHEGLAGIFPPEFNIASAGLDADELAKVLIHFAAHGIIAIPEGALRTSVKGVKPGWHSCQFYRDDEQYLKLLAPYMADGLRNGEGCFWVLPGTVTDEQACAALEDYVNDVDACLLSGQLELLSHREWYLDDAGQLKSFDEVSTALLLKQDRALAKGFRFLRAAGDAGWVSGTEESKGFIDYEMKVNAALQATNVAALCTFRANVTAEEIVAIVTAHQDALHCG